MTKNNAKPLTGDEIRAAVKHAHNMSGPSDATQPGEYVLAGALALLSKLRAEGVQAGEPVAEVRIGVSATGQDATICIIQPHADGTVTTIYSKTHPLGYSMGRAALASAPIAKPKRAPVDDGICWSSKEIQRRQKEEDEARAAYYHSRASAPVAGELPDAVRVPLDSLHADAGYLVGRVLDHSLSRDEVVAVIRSRIDAAKAALAAPQASEAVRDVGIAASGAETRDNSACPSNSLESDKQAAYVVLPPLPNTPYTSKGAYRDHWVWRDWQVIEWGRAAVLADRQQRAGDVGTHERMREVLQWIVDDASSGGVAKLRPQQEKRARAALSAQPGAQKEQCPWQAIDTAPKDQVILLFGGLKRDGKIYAPHINVGYWTEQFGWTCLVYAHQEFAHIEPTHWMPRPPFPAQAHPDNKEQ